MNILLWIAQIILAFFCVTGSVWRFLNYEQAAKDVASMSALSYEMWNAIGAFEVLCAIGLILPGILKLKPTYMGMAAAALAVEMLLLSGLHIKFFGLELKATNPATWSLSFFILAVFVAYGRLRGKAR